MSEIYVASSNALEQVINDLQAKNNEFHQYADNIRNEHKTLVTKWEGDASEAFEANFQKEEPNLTNFEQAITEYITALKKILAEYETAETQNVNIASN